MCFKITDADSLAFQLTGISHERFYSSEEPLASVNQTAALMEVASRSGFLFIHQRGLDPLLRHPALSAPPTALSPPQASHLHIVALDVFCALSSETWRDTSPTGLSNLSQLSKKKGKHVALSGITSSGPEHLLLRVGCWRIMCLAAKHVESALAILRPTFGSWDLVSVWALST